MLPIPTSEAAAILGITDAGVRMLVLRGTLDPLDRSARPMHFPLDVVVELEYSRRPKSERERIRRLARAWSLDEHGSDV